MSSPDERDRLTDYFFSLFLFSKSASAPLLRTAWDCCGCSIALICKMQELYADEIMANFKSTQSTATTATHQLSRKSVRFTPIIFSSPLLACKITGSWNFWRRSISGLFSPFSSSLCTIIRIVESKKVIMEQNFIVITQCVVCRKKKWGTLLQCKFSG